MEKVEYEIKYTMVNAGHERLQGTYPQFELAKKRYDEMTDPVKGKAYCKVTLVKVTRTDIEFHDRANDIEKPHLCEKCKYPVDYHYQGECPQ